MKLLKNPINKDKHNYKAHDYNLPCYKNQLNKHIRMQYNIIRKIVKLIIILELYINSNKENNKHNNYFKLLSNQIVIIIKQIIINLL